MPEHLKLLLPPLPLPHRPCTYARTYVNARLISGIRRVYYIPCARVCARCIVRGAYGERLESSARAAFLVGKEEVRRRNEGWRTVETDAHRGTINRARWKTQLARTKECA